MIEFTFSVTTQDLTEQQTPALSSDPIVAPAIVPSETLIRPFRRNGRGGFVTGDYVTAVRAAVGQVLGTELGTFAPNPAFGSRLYLLRQRPQNDEVGDKLATVYVVEALRAWERRAMVRSVVLADRYVPTIGAMVRTVLTTYDVVLPDSRSTIAERVSSEVPL